MHSPMMVHEDDDAEKEIPSDAVEELLDTDTEDEEDDELDLDAKDTVDEFGAGFDDEIKSTSRDWE